MKRCSKTFSILAMIALAAWGCEAKSDKGEIGLAISEREADEAKKARTGDGECKISQGEPLTVDEQIGRWPYDPALEALSPTFFFMPGDLATSLREDFFTLSLGVSSHEPLADDSLVHALKEAVRLTDAKSTPLPFRTEVRPAWSGTDIRGEVRVVPEEPLKDGWHWLGLGHIPEGFIERPYTDYLRSDDGSRWVRFRKGDWPMLWGVQVCSGKSDEKVSRIILEFEGRMILSGCLDKFIKITSQGFDLACQNVTPEDLGPAEKGHVPSYHRLFLRCAPVSGQDKITIELAESLVALGGPIQGPLIHHFRVDELEAWGTDCRLYRGSAAE
ncbi:MAG: hypothetical protein FWC40_09375 [Proteobacteria bacterium]|nr:hypothetical protein [Pseudomonadota bacterium]